MKRLFLFIAFIALVASVNAQLSTGLKTVTSNNYASVYTNNIVLADTSVNHIVNFQTDTEFKYSISVALDSNGTGAGATLQLSGKLWDTDTVGNIGSAVVWAGTSADTTIVFNQHTTDQFLQYMKLNIDGDSCIVDHIKERIWK